MYWRSAQRRKERTEADESTVGNEGALLRALFFLCALQLLRSTHAHFLLSPSSAGQIAKFMQFVNANVAKEAGRLHLWRERLWSRRYRSIVVADERAAHARLRYILAHGAKEGLVWTPGAWPGPNCIAALTVGEMLRGTWFDRSAEYLARQRGQTVLPSQFAATAFARAGTRAGGHVSPLGLPTSLAVQRPGVTGAGHHGASGAARQAFEEKLCPAFAVDGQSTA